jgi:hypothetical protein
VCQIFLAGPPDAGRVAPTTTTVKLIIRPKNPLPCWSLPAATFSTHLTQGEGDQQLRPVAVVTAISPSRAVKDQG